MLQQNTESLDTKPKEGKPAQTLRGLVVAILIFAMTGTFVDLLFLEHYGDRWQLIPLALLTAAALTLIWHAIHAGPTSVRAIQVVMSLLIAGGITGIVLHYRTSAEFQTELDATLSGAPLVWAVLHSKVPPTLAPAALIQMGLLGLAFTYKHPKRMNPITHRQEETK